MNDALVEEKYFYELLYYNVRYYFITTFSEKPNAPTLAFTVNNNDIELLYCIYGNLGEVNVLIVSNDSYTVHYGTARTFDEAARRVYARV